ncbi:hypothetical protein OV450_1454 [Actinobacteria bacterium OV450]|nr:hypothetical protein OV450_1454 [Actinobacteria bacterium OV450]
MLSPGLLTVWTREALAAARAGDRFDADELAGRIADRGDVMDLIAVCRVVADAAMRALIAVHGPLVDGEAWVLDPAEEDDSPADVFAGRLITAYTNRDHDTVTALVAAAASASPTERTESLQSLISYAAELEARAVQHRLDQEGTTPDD